MTKTVFYFEKEWRKKMFETAKPCHEATGKQKKNDKKEKAQLLNII